MGVPAKKPGKSKKGKKAPKPKLTAQELYVEAQMAWISDEPEEAKASLTRALQLEPENLKCLNMLGGLLAEEGPHEEAVKVLKKAVDLAPDTGFEKYMYLAQILEGEEGLAAVRKGIELIRAKLQRVESGQIPEEDLDSDEEFEEGEREALLESAKELTQAELSAALCTQSELLMAAAAGEGQQAQQGAAGLAAVEVEVEGLLEEARSLAPKSPEPLQALCSLRRLQGRREEALQLLQQSMQLWHQPLQEAEEAAATAAADAIEEIDLGEGEDDELMDEGEEGEGQPSYEFRFETAKLLLDMDGPLDKAIQILEDLVEEDDRVPNVWLLLALALKESGELDEALVAADEGMGVLKLACLPPDDEMVISFHELHGELERLLAAGGQGGDREEADKKEE